MENGGGRLGWVAGSLMEYALVADIAETSYWIDSKLAA